MSLQPRSKHPLAKRLLLSAFLAAASATGTYAQGVHQNSFPGDSGNGSSATSTGPKVYSGTAVPTSHNGPLNQPIPPAASSYYNRSQGRVATPTNPSPYPFGTQ